MGGSETIEIQFGTVWTQFNIRSTMVDHSGAGQRVFNNTVHAEPLSPESTLEALGLDIQQCVIGFLNGLLDYMLWAATDGGARENGSTWLAHTIKRGGASG